jgi:hypothetical protein
MFRNFINYCKNNSGKTLIAGHVGLFMGYDSYVFRKQTSPEIYLKNPEMSEKYNRHSAYSVIMRPIRLCKDHFWIQNIHRTLAEGYCTASTNEKFEYELTVHEVSRNKYSKFLKDFPYSENYLNNIYTGKVNPITSWLVDEFYAYDPDDDDDEISKKEMNILKAFGIYKSGHAYKNPEFVSKLLSSELEKKETLGDNRIINWCLRQQIENPRAPILSKISDELLNKLPMGFFNPDNVLTSFDHRVDSYGSDNSVLLLINKTYFKNMIKYFPEYLNKISNDSFQVLELYKRTDFGRRFIIENFDKFDKKIQLELCDWEVFSQPNPDPFVLTFIKDKSNLIDLLKKNKNISHTKLSKIVEKKWDICELIFEGHCQLFYDIPNEFKKELMDSRTVDKLLMNQHNLNNETVRDLLIIYEKKNPDLTKTELDHFIKTYQPKYFDWLYNKKK